VVEMMTWHDPKIISRVDLIPSPLMIFIADKQAIPYTETLKGLVINSQSKVEFPRDRNKEVPLPR